MFVIYEERISDYVTLAKDQIIYLFILILFAFS